jgi:hypothetical protein
MCFHVKLEPLSCNASYDRIDEACAENCPYLNDKFQIQDDP